MTREEFNKTGFGGGMVALYKIDKRQSKPEEYLVSAVSFNEGLLELNGEDGDRFWVRCESIEIKES